MNKKDKLTSQKKSSLKDIIKAFDGILNVLKVHGVLVMFLIAGAAIGFSLVRSQDYLDPARDEAKYNELSSGMSYKKIDYNLVKKLKSALEDTDVSVSQSLAPDRSNPFNE
ncbi:MAG: hypothetical protein WCJ60_04075 [bacterium]